MARRSLVITIGGGFIALCVASIVVCSVWEAISGKDIRGHSLTSSGSASGAAPGAENPDAYSPSDSVWNGYRISGAVPGACKGKPMPSRFDIAMAADSAAKMYGNPKGSVEVRLIQAGNFSFDSIGQGDDGKCKAFFIVSGNYEGTSFADPVMVNL